MSHKVPKEWRGNVSRGKKKLKETTIFCLADDVAKGYQFTGSFLILYVLLANLILLKVVFI